MSDTESDGRGDRGLTTHAIRLGEVELALLRPRDPEALIDEDAFEQDEFLPYWAELWPSALALARALPVGLTGQTVVEVGCGLGIPSLIAAARGAEVTAIDWAAPAIELLRENAARNGLMVKAQVADWRTFEGTFDVAIAADVLYERRNVEPLLELLPKLAPTVILAEPGRPAGNEFLRRGRGLWAIEEIADRVWRLTPHSGVQ
ncbi:MAG TPA: class I SAM-dependent methyltransferase [Gaiellaceae bacterium]|nr:class I SAM-dependent methyltransferase [Gaiellaceae bacterium]